MSVLPLMVGAMVALSAIGVLQNHFPGLGNVPTLIIALIIAAVVCAAVGYTIERVAYRPLRKAPRLAPLIGWNSVDSWYSTTTKTLPSSDLAWNLRISCSKGAALLDAAEPFAEMMDRTLRRL